MQIRERAKCWALIRTTYDKARKRGVARCIGTVPKVTAVIERDLREQLSEPERFQVDKLLREVRMRRDIAKREHYARFAPEILAQIAAFYDNPVNPIPNIAALARDSREEFSRVLAAMARAGVGRTRRMAVKGGGKF